MVRSVTLLLGQTATVDLQMSPSTVQESVTVTGEAPLIDTQSPVLAGNIDPKQFRDGGGYGRRIHAGSHRSAPSRRRQRHLGSAIRITGKRRIFLRSGLRFSTSVGGDPRGQAADGENRYRTASTAVGSGGTIAPRNNLVGSPIHRLDMRLQKHVNLRGRAGIDGMQELFNVFNHANDGSYTTQESSASHGLPAFNHNVSYGPRALQIGFRVQF